MIHYNMLIPKGYGIPLFSKNPSQAPRVFGKGNTHHQNMITGSNQRSLEPNISGYSPSSGSNVKGYGRLAPEITESLAGLVKSKRGIQKIRKY